MTTTTAKRRSPNTPETRPWSKSQLLPNPLSPRQERFASLVASGTPHVDAYRQVYARPNTKMSTIYTAAHILARRNNKIAKRIAELRELTRIEVDSKYVSDRMERTYELATADRQHAAAVKAVDLSAKVAGLYRDGDIVQTTIQSLSAPFAGLTTDELRKLLVSAEQVEDWEAKMAKPQVVDGEYRQLAEPAKESEDQDQDEVGIHTAGVNPDDNSRGPAGGV